MPFEITLLPIGHVRGGRSEPLDDSWDTVECTIALEPRFGPDALAGLDGFSHVEIVFQFDQVAEDRIICGARHPRGRADWPKAGIFAQRGKARPNRIGITVSRLLAVEGTVLKLRGLDAIDGTPVLDIKPVMKGFLPRGEVREPDWASQIMKQYW